MTSPYGNFLHLPKAASIQKGHIFAHASLSSTHQVEHHHIESSRPEGDQLFRHHSFTRFIVLHLSVPNCFWWKQLVVLVDALDGLFEADGDEQADDDGGDGV
jgi:hypothetical protein